MEAVSVKNTGPSFITTSGKQVHKGWLVTSQTPPPTQLAIEKGEPHERMSGREVPYSASCLARIIQVGVESFVAEARSKKKGSARGICWKGRECGDKRWCGAISGLEEGAPP